MFRSGASPGALFSVVRRSALLIVVHCGRRLAAAARAVAISVGLLLSFGTAAVAAGSVVVPPTGKVAGEGYAYYNQRSTQHMLDASLPVRPCQTLAVNGQRVAYLTLTTVAPTPNKYTCNEPAGRPLYVVDIGNECSTKKGDHHGFGTSDSQLVKCAKALFSGLTQSATVDGRSVNVSGLITATGAFPVDIPKNPLFPLPPGNGRSATYGPGLLLAGLSKGTHTINGVTKPAPPSGTSLGTCTCAERHDRTQGGHDVFV